MLGGFTTCSAMCGEWTDGTDASKVLQGGSWDCFPRGVRASYRLWSGPAARVSDVGFRRAWE